MGGGGAAPQPVQLLLSALAGCEAATANYVGEISQASPCHRTSQPSLCHRGLRGLNCKRQGFPLPSAERRARGCGITRHQRERAAWLAPAPRTLTSEPGWRARSGADAAAAAPHRVLAVSVARSARRARAAHRGRPAAAVDAARGVRHRACRHGRVPGAAGCARTPGMDGHVDVWAQRGRGVGLERWLSGGGGKGGCRDGTAQKQLDVLLQYTCRTPVHMCGGGRAFD
eukprot:364644-Chlamydomonas_euryale.AAC.21